MKFKSLLIIAAVCLCLVQLSGAQTSRAEIFLTTADDFMSHCGPLDPGLSSDMRTLTEGARKETIPICDMYVFGIFEGIELYDAIAVQHSKTMVKPDDSVCIMGSISPDEMRKIVVRYIQDDPEIVKQKMRTDAIALLAFEKAFPCPNSGAGTQSSPPQ